MHTSAFRRAFVLPLILLAASACSEKSAPVQGGIPRTISAVSSLTFTAPVASRVAEPLVVRVADDQSRPVRGATVRFTVADQMATLDPVETETDAKGEARTTVTLGEVAGRVDVTARLVGTDSTVRFTITASPLAASRVTVVPDPMRLHAGGLTGQLYGSAADQYGNGIGGSAVTYQSLDPTVATATSTGLVTGIQLGATARIQARTAEGFTDTVLVSVADPGTSVCTGAVTTLAAGESVLMDPRDGTCLRSATDAEYVAVPFFASEAPNGQTDQLRAVGTGLAAPVAARFAADARVTGAEPRPMPDDSFERTIRARELREIAPLAERAHAMREEHAPGALYNAVPSTVTIGDYVTINASPTYACSFPDDASRRKDMRVGRVVAITAKAIVVADTSNPAGGFTDDEYRRLGVTFDTLVAPVNEELFGTPGDIDGNQRSVIFYTGRVNQITTDPGAYVGGFFWSRDLLPRSVCATGNVAEIFYMLVPDPNGVLGARRSKAFVEQVTVGTIGHEFQHLINASRRFADPGAEPTEVTWLNEGLSHIAEEMLFYRAAGLQPRMNIGGSDFGSARFEQAFYDFQFNNITRLERWLAAPKTNTPYGLSGALPTRGAAWAFLRYLADRQPTEGNVWFRLVNNQSTGIANVEEVFGVDVLTSARDWAVAMYADDYAIGAAPQHQMPSWNFRTLFPALDRPGYPLVTAPLTNNVEQLSTLRGGGAAYHPFTTTGGIDARVWLRTVVGGPQPAVKVTIVRVR